MLEFRKLNLGWNAEPNCPVPLIRLQGDDVLLEFVLNAFIYKQFAEEECGILRFSGCSRYRLGGTNDEGWWMGQCRYSKLAPYWGEFYELIGDDPLRDQPTDWVLVGHSQRSRHFLFCFRDDTFECVADDWAIEPGNPLHRVVESPPKSAQSPRLRGAR